ncbi:DUF2892 domain-containing protein [Haloplasma contractile]|uniref:DUF2892 domain-containing protein n=1 Tax=Haloplasma contractile SSD-17B TaxID=1033810 RepID=U2DUS0_9MOLU|nr:DUF2892 domain-containing protein [Haloplasma contractile]ERJ12152.1 hypothetical protein HLPCO_001679 [Haloplasma contractile SSD-17B]
MKRILPPTSKRVHFHTNQKVNEKIKDKTLERIEKYKDAELELLNKRIKKLNREWDTESVLEANASAIIFVSLILGFQVHRYWFILPLFISFFLFQHAVQGWCPPLPIIRRLGVRTAEEIHDEKMALRMIRGDLINEDTPEELFKKLSEND